MKYLKNLEWKAYWFLNFREGIRFAQKALGTSIQMIFRHLVQIVSTSRGELAESRTLGRDDKKQRNRVIEVSQMGQSLAFSSIHEPEPNYFELGVNYSCGRQVVADLVEAHKWFNIAALRGDSEAARRRQEIASEMSAFEIAAAQRRAREWLSVH